MTHKTATIKVSKGLDTVRYYRGLEYMGWQKYSFKSRFFEVRNWLQSDAAHSVRIGRLVVTLDNINALPVNERDVVAT